MDTLDQVDDKLVQIGQNNAAMHRLHQEALARIAALERENTGLLLVKMSAQDLVDCPESESAMRNLRAALADYSVALSPAPTPTQGEGRWIP